MTLPAPTSRPADEAAQRPQRSRRRAPPGVLALALALAGWPQAARAQSPERCAQEPDDARRLACYDALFGRPVAPGAQAPPPVARQEPAPAPPPARAPASLLVATYFERAWELTPAHKRGTFLVRTYQPNFLLPAHYTSRINQSPSSPTRPAPDDPPDFKHVEAKVQVSLRAKMAEGLLLPNADLWFAYTARSMWQVWNPGESSPFRNTDYQPEVIYVVPVPEPQGRLPAGWRWRMAQLGYVHQSNGQSEPLSRSWNRVYLSASADRGEVGLTLRAYKRLPESEDDDDNPDITRLVGNAELVAAWLPGRATASLTWRSDRLRIGRGSVQLDWTYPVDPDQPSGLRWYAQLFHGYGETLLDYNHRQTSIGLGLTLFQF